MSSSTIIKEEESNSEEYIYYNLRVSNPIGSGTVIPTAYSSTRVDTILDKCNDYKLSVIRFQLPANFPLFIYPQDPNLFQVKLTNGVNSVTQDLIYTQKYETYIERGIYYINHYIEILNKALEQAHAALLILDPTIAYEAPFFVYDSNVSTKIYFVAPVEYLDGNLSNISLSLSPILFNFGFQEFPVADGNLILHNDFIQLSIFDNKIDNRITIGGSGGGGGGSGGKDYYKIYSEADTTSTLNKFSDIVILTDSIPILPENISSQLNETQRILTDFVPVSEQGLNGSYYQYFANVYRYTNLVSNESLRKVDIKIYILYQTGEYYQHRLLPNQYFTAKLMFVRNEKVNS